MGNVYSSWLSSGAIWEKYSCEEEGQPGGGGEYHVQTGFGWTNGVSLSLLAKFPDMSSAAASPTTTITNRPSILASVLLGLVSVFRWRV